MCAATITTFGTSGSSHMNVKADTEAPTPNLQMLQATDLNLKQRIMELRSHRHASKVNRTQLASLRTQAANVESQITSIQVKQSEAAASSAAASSAAASSQAAAQSVAASLAAASSQAAAQSAAASSQAAAQSAAASSAAASSQAAAQSAAASSAAAASSQVVVQSASTPTPSSASSSASSDGSGLNMNQTSGTVDVNALGAYLASHKGIYSAEKWARIIYRESNGRVDAQNPSSGAYGVLQLLGHGEYRGMTLGAQLQMAMPLPASAWAETNY